HELLPVTGFTRFNDSKQGAISRLDIGEGLEDAKVLRVVEAGDREHEGRPARKLSHQLAIELDVLKARRDEGVVSVQMLSVHIRRALYIGINQRHRSSG